MPTIRRAATAVLLTFTLITAAAPDGAAWRQDDHRRNLLTHSI